MSYKVVIVYLMFNCALAQGQEIKVTPKIDNLSLDDQAVTLVYLSPGYATAIRMPDEIISVVIGDPAKFKAEHSESESRLVFLKPVTPKPAESNALITMKSGQAVSLHLVSSGSSSVEDPRVDFFVEFRRPKGLLLDSGGPSFFVVPTESIAQGNPDFSDTVTPRTDWIAQILSQQSASTPHWQGKELLAALGQSMQQGTQTVVGFSVVNQSKTSVELLPPQLEISGRASNGGKQTRAEPIALSEYRMTLRRLQPGERTDGVVVFERPAFKESGEKLELRLAQADQVDRPLILPVPFIAMVEGGVR